MSESTAIKGVNPAQSRTFHQLGLFVLDGSGSMSEKSSAKGNTIKALEVDQGMNELFNRMKVSRVDQNFSFGVMKFDNRPTVIVEPQRFVFDEFSKHSYNTRKGQESDCLTGGTEIYNALAKAKEYADAFLKDEDIVPQSVLILLMSDGMCFDPVRTRQIATEIKANPLVKIASVYMANIGEVDRDAAQLMKDVASDNMTTTVYDGDTLRSFFERSISQTSGVKVGVETGNL